MSQQINLFNPVFLRQEKHFSALAMAQGLGLIFLGLAGLTGYSYYREARLSADAVAVSQRLKSAQAQLAELVERNKQQPKSQALEEEVLLAEARLKIRRQALDIVQQGELSNTKGYSEYFRAFARQSTNGLWLTGFSIDAAGNDIEIDGRALQPELVPAYIRAIRREPVFQGKSFATLQMRSTRDAPASPAAPDSTSAYVEFTLQSSASTNAPGGTPEVLIK